MLNSLACVVIAVLSARACAGGGEMYGLVLTHNSPSEVSLAQLDTKGGNWSLIGGQHSVLDGMGDLSAVDTKTQTFYYLGDTSGGTTLLGVSLKDGSEVCQGVIPVAEKGYVGIAQSIDYDPTTDSLVISGLSPDKNASSGHSVYRTGGCTKDKKVEKLEFVGQFGDASWVPMLHASALDSTGQRLFVTLATAQSTFAIGVIDLQNKGDMIVIAEDSSNHMMYGMHYDPERKNLIGVVQNAAGGLDLKTLAVEGAKPTWQTSTLPPQDYEWLYGNMGTVSAINQKGGFLYVLAGKNPNKLGDPPLPAMHLVEIDVRHSKVTATPAVAKLPLGTNTILEMNFVQ
jgi:hypothetical protein